MKLSRFAILAMLALLLAGCGAPSKFRTYNGPAVTQVVVQKSARKMYLLHNGKVLRDYDIGLGFAPAGHKQIEGDGRTPEGSYIIDRRNPNSRFHLSIGVSYPNELDRALADELGKSPGGDIFIHGRPKQYRNNVRDWTWGCIAVTDREIEDIYAMVRDGTPIHINP
ncbi:L,D-transpeptidase family protein [Puniceibacterium confluentis]|uniref:L,D-transpeptidase family protein n=1 Tax=Puniceibacterium confluentis TaxID=1958944 RepID=UPI0011B3BAF8|nr:L,D-transpeptidase family protein [Puniceibacterium confluentis]